MTLQQTPKDERQVGLTANDVAEIRRRADADVFYFGRVICGHKDLVLEDHGPLMYAAAGQADRLLALLRSDLDSYTIRQFKQECARFSIDLEASDAQGRLAEHIRVVDLRVYRGSGKSSALTHAVRLWKMVKFPDMSSALITNVDDPKARDFCKQIRATIQTDLFAAVYPDRVPADPKGMLTENRLTLAGRTIPDKEPCLMVFGHKSSPTGYHFDELQFDDLVGRENRSIIEIALVRDFLSHVADLYNPGIRFPIRRVHIGTRWDEEDDAAYVRAYPKCLSVTVPIWKRDSPTDDIRIPGVPTTRWKPLEACIAKQEEILANPEEGALSWRCNNELDPAVAGGRIFPADLVDSAKWMPFRDVVQTKGREFVMRHQFDAKNERLPKDRAFDKDALYKVICCDQSFSESQSADQWAVSCVGMDQFGHRFHLETRTGHGLDTMMDAMEMMRIEWKPMRIGMEKIAAQQAIDLFLKASTKFQRLYAMVEPVSHQNLVKEYRIRNYVAEIMRMKRFWLNPNDIDTAQEMKKYKPGKNAKDNILDSLAMCEVLIQKSLAPKDEEEDWKSKFRRSNALNHNRRDPRTGVALY